MKTWKTLACALSASILVAASVSPARAQEGAARLVRIEGEVMITRDNGSVSGTEGGALRIGDRLIALEGGRALIRFADGCTYPLGDSEVFTVPAKSPCASGWTPAVAAKGLTGGGAAASGGLFGLGSVPAGALPGILGAATALGAAVDSSSDRQGGDRAPISP